jgi:hypothetical protein
MRYLFSFVYVPPHRSAFDVLFQEAVAAPSGYGINLVTPAPPPAFGALPKQLAARRNTHPSDLQLPTRMVDDAAAVRGLEQLGMAQLDDLLQDLEVRSFPASVLFLL